MPPEGYTTVTLPDELVAQIDDHPEPTRADTIQSLLNTGASKETVTVDGGSVDDIANQTAQKVVRELESTLR